MKQTIFGVLAGVGVGVLVWTAIWAVLLGVEVAKAWRRQDDDRP